MCEAASFIVCRTGKPYWFAGSDSHQRIREHHGLPDNDRIIHNVQVEITPPHHNYALAFSHWRFQVDQDQLPRWWDREAAEAACRRELEAWAQVRLVRAGQHRTHVGAGDEVIVCGGDVAHVDGGRIRRLCSGTVHGLHGGTCDDVDGGAIVGFSSGRIKRVRGGDIHSINGGEIDSVYGGHIRYVNGGRINLVSGGRIEVLTAGLIDNVRGGSVDLVQDGVVARVCGSGAVDIVRGGAVTCHTGTVARVHGGVVTFCGAINTELAHPGVIVSRAASVRGIRVQACVGTKVPQRITLVSGARGLVKTKTKTKAKAKS